MRLLIKSRSIRMEYYLFAVILGALYNTNMILLPAHNATRCGVPCLNLVQAQDEAQICSQKIVEDDCILIGMLVECDYTWTYGLDGFEISGCAAECSPPAPYEAYKCILAATVESCRLANLDETAVASESCKTKLKDCGIKGIVSGECYLAENPINGLAFCDCPGIRVKGRCNEPTWDSTKETCIPNGVAAMPKWSQIVGVLK